MRVLLLNNDYRRSVGGTEAVVTHTERLLRAAGHETAVFSASDGARAGVYSLAARRDLERALDGARPDVAHLHNVYGRLTLSVLDALRSRRVPTVLTLHDYRAVCANGYLLASDGPCERCVRGSALRHAVARRCVRGSITASGVAALEVAANRRRRQYGKVDVVLAPTRLMREVASAAGVAPERVRLVPNPVRSSPAPRTAPAAPPRFVFFGRLVPEKGLDVLLDASAMLEPGVRVIVYGTGRHEEHVRRRVARERLPVEVRGHAPRDEVLREVEEATAVVVPSLWFENRPMALLEAAGRGVPPVASDIGTLREAVSDGRDGLLFPPGDAAALARALRRLTRDRELALRLGAGAWRRVRRVHDPGAYLAAVLAAYADAARPVGSGG